MTFKILRTEELILNCSEPLLGMYKLSPLVWQENDRYLMLIRAVNTSEDATQKVARIYSGVSDDGVTFTMSDGPVIAPGTDPLDKDGCEDPTVVRLSSGYLVYYTGWNQTTKEGQLLLAKGATLDSLALDKIAIRSEPDHLNPKEATVTQLQDGQWNLFFEYANEDRSKLGIATSQSPEGPWTVEGEYLGAVSDNWDSYHLSPGPVLTDIKGETIMFYNGADDQARWRIGWVRLDKAGKIIERSAVPLITPPKNKPGETDIAFASSAVHVDDQVWLYYTTADKSTFRAIIELTHH